MGGRRGLRWHLDLKLSLVVTSALPRAARSSAPARSLSPVAREADEARVAGECPRPGDMTPARVDPAICWKDVRGAGGDAGAWRSERTREDALGARRRPHVRPPPAVLASSAAAPTARLHPVQAEQAGWAPAAQTGREHLEPSLFMWGVNYILENGCFANLQSSNGPKHMLSQHLPKCSGIKYW